jgi:anti-anti-sigma regulatory factor
MRERGQAAVVSLPREIDVANADDVLVALLAAVQTEAPVIIADMGRTTFCGTEGVLALMRAAEAASGAGAVLRVTGAARTPRRVLILLGQEALLGDTPGVPNHSDRPAASWV